MCMMDWRIGRLIKWNSLGVGSASLTIKPNRQRVALQISPLDYVTVGIVDSLCLIDDVTQLPFYCRDLGTAAKLFTLAEYGEIIQHGFVLENLTGDNSFVAHEAIMPEEYLAAGLEQFISEYARWKGSN